MALRIVLILLAALVPAGLARANGFSLFTASAPATALLAPGDGIVAAAAQGPRADEVAAADPQPIRAAAPTGSLFAGNRSGSLFAPLPPRAPPPPAMTGGVAELLALIARAEAGRDGYDAINHGARIRTRQPPSRMTLGEIQDWIAATPGQPHAIGRYQFIPETLRRVAALRGYGPGTRFSPEVQDALAGVLLAEAGLEAFQSGAIDRRTFMRNLARIWAGLPLPDGRSYYEGHAGNRATMTWAAFEAGLERIWPRG